VENIFKEVLILVEKLLCGADDDNLPEISLLRQLSQEAQDTEEDSESDAMEFEEDGI
jgi:hypothetical protein